LNKTEITDDGLKELAALKNLKELQLSFTQVTDDGVKQFEAAVPGCQVKR